MIEKTIRNILPKKRILTDQFSLDAASRGTPKSSSSYSSTKRSTQQSSYSNVRSALGQSGSSSSSTPSSSGSKNIGGSVSTTSTTARYTGGSGSSTASTPTPSISPLVGKAVLITAGGQTTAYTGGQAIASGTLSKSSGGGYTLSGKYESGGQAIKEATQQAVDKVTTTASKAGGLPSGVSIGAGGKISINTKAPGFMGGDLKNIGWQIQAAKTAQERGYATQTQSQMAKEGYGYYTPKSDLAMSAEKTVDGRTVYRGADGSIIATKLTSGKVVDKFGVEVAPPTVSKQQAQTTTQVLQTLASAPQITLQPQMTPVSGGIGYTEMFGAKTNIVDTTFVGPLQPVDFTKVKIEGYKASEIPGDVKLQQFLGQYSVQPQGTQTNLTKDKGYELVPQDLLKQKIVGDTQTYATPKDLAQIETEISRIQIGQSTKGDIGGNWLQNTLSSGKAWANRWLSGTSKQSNLQADIQLSQNEVELQHAKQLDTTVAKYQPKIDEITKTAEALNKGIENLNKKYADLGKEDEQLQKLSTTVDVTDVKAVNDFNKRAELLQSQYQQLQKEEANLKPMEAKVLNLQKELEKADTEIAGINKLYMEKVLTYQKLSENVKELDPAYVAQKRDWDQLMRLKESDANLATKALGTGMYGLGRVGQGATELFRGVGTLAVKPILMAGELGEQARASGKGYNVQEFAGIVTPGLSQARAVYDWENPNLSKYGSRTVINPDTGKATKIGYSWSTGLDTQAVSGLVTLGTLGAGSALGFRSALKSAAPAVNVAKMTLGRAAVKGLIGATGTALVFGPGIVGGISEVRAGQSQLASIDQQLNDLEINKGQYSTQTYKDTKDFLTQQRALVVESKKDYGEVAGGVLQTTGTVAGLALAGMSAAKEGRAYAQLLGKTPIKGGLVKTEVQTERIAQSEGGVFGKPQRGTVAPSQKISRVNVEKMLPQEGPAQQFSTKASFTEGTTQGTAKSNIQAFASETPGQYKFIKTQEFGSKNWGSWFGKNKLVGKRVDIVTQLPGETSATRQIFVNDKLMRSITEAPLSGADSGLMGQLTAKLTKFERGEVIRPVDQLTQKSIESDIIQSSTGITKIKFNNVFKQQPNLKLKGELNIKSQVAEYSKRLPTDLTETTTVTVGKTPGRPATFQQFPTGEGQVTGKLDVGKTAVNIRPSVTTKTKYLTEQQLIEKLTGVKTQGQGALNYPISKYGELNFYTPEVGGVKYDIALRESEALGKAFPAVFKSKPAGFGGFLTAEQPVTFTPTTQAFSTQTATFPGVNIVKVSSARTIPGTEQFLKIVPARSTPTFNPELLWRPFKKLGESLGTMPRLFAATPMFPGYSGIGMSLAPQEIVLQPQVLTKSGASSLSVLQGRGESQYAPSIPRTTTTPQTSVVTQISRGSTTFSETGALSQALGSSLPLVGAMPSMASLIGLSTLGGAALSQVGRMSPVTKVTPVSKLSLTPSLSQVMSPKISTSLMPITSTLTALRPSPITTTSPITRTVNTTTIIPGITSILGLGALSLGGLNIPTFGSRGGGLPQGVNYGRPGRGMQTWLVENKVADYGGEWLARQKTKSSSVEGIQSIIGVSKVKGLKGVL